MAHDILDNSDDADRYFAHLAEEEETYIRKTGEQMAKERYQQQQWMRKKMNTTANYIPSQEEKEKTAKFVSDIQVKIKELIKARVADATEEVQTVAVGSTVKGTYLSGDHDVDIYVLTEYPNVACEAVSKISADSGYFKRSGTLLIWNFQKDGYDVDVVFAKPDDPKVDTLRHAEFFNKYLSEEQKEYVIHLKALFKTYGLYGAETGGITGVAIEELVRQHRTANMVFMHFATLKLGNLEEADRYWFLQDPVLTTTRNLLASVIRRRRTQIITLSQEVFGRCQKWSYEPFTLEKFMDNWIHESIFQIGDIVIPVRNHPFFLKLLRKKEAHVDFTLTLGVANTTLRKITSVESDIHGEVDVYLDDEHIIVAADLPNFLDPYKFHSISKQYLDGIPAFKAKHEKWVDTGGEITTIVPRKIATPQKYFKTWFAARMEALGYLICSSGLQGTL